MGHVKQDAMPVIRELAQFDRHSGNLLERLGFHHRALLKLLMTPATLVLGDMAMTRPIARWNAHWRAANRRPSWTGLQPDRVRHADHGGCANRAEIATVE